MNKNKNVLDLVMMLSRGSMSLEKIALRFSVSYRTARRYIESIRNSDIPLIDHKPDRWRPMCYEVPLRENPQDKDRELDLSWQHLLQGYRSISRVMKNSVIVLCESCNIEKKITPIPDDRPKCRLCHRPVVVDRFV